MKYLCLVYLEEKTMSALPRSERRAISEEAMAYCDKLQKAGQLLAASPLQPVDGQKFMALNGGPHFKFTEAISFFVDCQTQEEVDELWKKLSRGGEPGRRGWLKDKFGVSWQIIPSVLGEMLNNEDDYKSGRVMQAMLQMGKLDIAGLTRAYNG